MLYTNPKAPYKSFAGDIWRSSQRRLVEYAKFLSTGESQRIFEGYKQLRDKCTEGKAIIVCNGPSLNDSNSEIYCKYPLIGLNLGALMNTCTSANYICNILADNLVILQNKSKVDQLKGMTFGHFSLKKELTSQPARYFYGAAPDFLPYSSPSSLVPSFGNSTSIAAQILFYSGVSKVAVIGLDHDYGDIRPLTLLSADKLSTKYADKNNAPSGQTVQAPDLMRVAYNLRNLMYLYSDHGKLLVNCSTKTRLDALPRISLEEFDAL